LLESADEHGWDGDGNVVWSDICYPNEVDVLLAGMMMTTRMIWMWKLKTRLNVKKENARFVIRMYMLVMSCIT
jgi:hypothetical protein